LVVVELIESVSDSLERVCVLMAAAADAPGQMQSGLRNTVQMMERRMSGYLREANAQADFLMEVVTDDYQQRAKAARGADRVAPRTPPRDDGGRGATRSVVVSDVAERKRSKVPDPRPVITGVRSEDNKATKAGRVRVSGVSEKKRTAHATSIKRGA
jgi:hypothetical protein